jgi:hypothetical protein
VQFPFRKSPFVHEVAYWSRPVRVRDIAGVFNITENLPRGENILQRRVCVVSSAGNREIDLDLGVLLDAHQ